MFFYDSLSISLSFLLLFLFLFVSFLLAFFRLFLCHQMSQNPSRKMLGEYLNLGHNRLLSYPFQPINHPIISCYILRITDSIIKQNTNK
jgi:hypothetical protein